MGLIYSSSDSSSLINGLKANLNSGKEVTEQLKSGSQKVIAAVDGKTLSGAAYTAGKGLFSELILPTISKVTTAIDNVEQELQQYTTANGKIAGEGNLDEDKLNQQITIKKSMKASVEASAVVARALSRMNPVANILDSLLNIQKNLNQMAESLEEDIRELEDKLEKLREFSAETSGLFTNSLSDMKLAMQGILVLNNTIVNKDGTYQLPVGTDIHWFKQLKKQSELDRIIGKERPPNVGNREYKLIDLGYGKIWCWVEKGKNVATAEDVRVTLAYNEWLSRMVDKYGLSFIQGERPKGIDELFYEQNATLIKELATGIDSVTGKKLSTVEKLEKASLLANGMITIGVMVKGVLNVGKTQNPKSVKPNKKASGADTTAKDLSQFEKLKGEYASKEIPNADRIGSGLKDDPSHRAASFITEEQLAKGRVTSFTGSDNKSYSMLQTKGNLNGLDGIYEYILDSTGKITHQRFIEGGRITGFPNQKVPKGGY